MVASATARESWFSVIKRAMDVRERDVWLCSHPCLRRLLWLLSYLERPVFFPASQDSTATFRTAQIQIHVHGQ